MSGIELVMNLLVDIVCIDGNLENMLKYVMKYCMDDVLYYMKIIASSITKKDVKKAIKFAKKIISSISKKDMKCMVKYAKKISSCIPKKEIMSIVKMLEKKMPEKK